MEMLHMDIFENDIFENNEKEIKEILEAAIEYLKEKPEIPSYPFIQYDYRIMNALYSLEPDYQYVKNSKPIINKEIEQMDLDEIATMYTYIYRSERFCDGFIAGCMENGYLNKLFCRHLELISKEENN